MTEREDLQRRLKELDEEDRLARQARMDAVKMEWEYTILPTDRPWRKSWDDTLVWYDITGSVTNLEEAEAAGHKPQPGRMSYLFNTVTGKLVMNSGGGTVYIETLDGRDDDLAAATRKLVNEFLRDHPEGGDITHIVAAFQIAKRQR